MAKKGFLHLENGSVFEGISFGSEEDVYGEVVFNTGMVGYPESFTDPSYFGQILTMTYPLIGSYGVPANYKLNGISQSFESERIRIRGLIVSTYIENKSHWQANETLSSFLKREKIPALLGIDTRTLTMTLREKGVMKGRIIFDKSRLKSGFIFPDINKENLVAKVSCKEPVTYGCGKRKIILLDCGVKNNQLQILLNLNTTIIRVPWDYNPFSKSNKFKFNALLISNGPGDPKMAKETINTVRVGIQKHVPILGICLGNQILALAAGGDTYKLKYGHRSQNQPVIELKSKRCFITTQNHGFTVNQDTLPPNWEPWFSNLNDKTNEGIKNTNYPHFSIQFHPEAKPGPTDTEWILNYFCLEIDKCKWIN